jgi:hypothetical protein
MGKKLIAILCSFGLIAFNPSPAQAADTVRYKSTQGQTIPKGKWVTLDFNGKKSIKGNGSRSLFCYQVGIDTSGKKKPKYIKIRLTRIVPGPNDTTATNTYFITDKPGSEFVGSNCWTIFTKHPVSVQVRITGGSSSYRSDVRQFKMWTPGADYPEDFSDFIPETTIN